MSKERGVFVKKKGRRTNIELVKDLLKRIDDIIMDYGYINPSLLEEKTGLNWSRARDWLIIFGMIGRWRKVLVKSGTREYWYKQKVIAKLK